MTGTVYSKFFWSDWMSDTGLRASSYAARGLWMDLLCIAAYEKGFVKINGRSPAADEIAKITCGSSKEVETLLLELESNGVFSRNRRGEIYSRRMVKAEKNRENGKLGGNPKLLNNISNQDSLNQTPKPHNTISHIPDTIIEEDSPSVRRETQPEKEKGKSMKGARLSEGWLPSAEDHLYAVGLLGAEGVARQLDDFRDYWMAKSGQGALKLDWARTWRTWCRKAKDWKGNGNGSGRSRPLQDDSLSASRAAGRLAEAAKRGEFVFGPRPSLFPAKSADDLLLLPKGRDS